MSNSDHFFMHKAIALAKKGLGKTHPNPCVGAIVVKNKKVLGQGFHLKAGQEHAEIIALKQAGNKARNAELYVTLEPCTHQGKTPPCVDSIINAGISRVIIGAKDPNPLVNGGGIKKLVEAGINVNFDIMSPQCEDINKGFMKRMKKGQPFIRSKIACSFDGRTSLKNSDSQWISSSASRQDVQYWRSISSAIITGVGTINKDNPQLNLRPLQNDTQPLRIILDTNLSINLAAKILSQANVLIFYHDDPLGVRDILEKKGIRLIQSKITNDRIDLNAVMDSCRDLELNDILIEAGPTLNGEFLKAQLIDELVIYQAPILMAGEAAGLFNQPVLETMKNKIHLEHSDIRNFANDIRYVTKIHYHHVD